VAVSPLRPITLWSYVASWSTSSHAGVRGTSPQRLFVSYKSITGCVFIRNTGVAVPCLESVLVLWRLSERRNSWNSGVIVTAYYWRSGYGLSRRAAWDRYTGRICCLLTALSDNSVRQRYCLHSYTFNLETIYPSFISSFIINYWLKLPKLVVIPTLYRYFAVHTKNLPLWRRIWYLNFYLTG